MVRQTAERGGDRIHKQPTNDLSKSRRAVRERHETTNAAGEIVEGVEHTHAIQKAGKVRIGELSIGEWVGAAALGLSPWDESEAAGPEETMLAGDGPVPPTSDGKIHKPTEFELPATQDNRDGIGIPILVRVCDQKGCRTEFGSRN